MNICYPHTPLSPRLGDWLVSQTGKVCLMIGAEIPPGTPINIEAGNHRGHVTLVPTLHEKLGMDQ